MPNLAKLFAMDLINHKIIEFYIKVRPLIRENPECIEGADLHCFLSAVKVLFGWYAIEAI